MLKCLRNQLLAAKSSFWIDALQPLAFQGHSGLLWGGRALGVCAAVSWFCAVRCSEPFSLPCQEDQSKVACTKLVIMGSNCFQGIYWADTSLSVLKSKIIYYPETTLRNWSSVCQFLKNFSMENVVIYLDLKFLGMVHWIFPKELVPMAWYSQDAI